MKLEDIVKYCKQYGFVFQGSEIYGGLANSWDYGPLGLLLINNLKNEWLKKFVQERRNSYAIDSTILMNSNVWKASGHIDGFSDLLMDCKVCKKRYRVDTYLEDYNVDYSNMDSSMILKKIYDDKLVCPNCKSLDFTDIRNFNLMFKTHRGVTEENLNVVYLRPENAQGEYVNFLNVSRSMRSKIPFGIGQIGKAFRNEITPGNFVFRTIEFEQMEYQYFCKEEDGPKNYEDFKKIGMNFFEYLGLPSSKLRFKDHEKLAHYARNAVDIEYLFSFGWGEINGTHNRGDFDLKNHQEYSKVSMEYLDDDGNKFIPHIIESTYGVGRTFLALINEFYVIEDEREILKIPNFLAPYKCAILPLIKKVHSELSEELYEKLSKSFMVNYDETGSIGKRYRRNDAIGTPFCITIDDDSLNNNTVTIRNRDNMIQEVINIDDIKTYIEERVK